MDDSKKYVAVGKDVKDRESILKWVLKRLRGRSIFIIHVHVPAQLITLPNGLELPVSSVSQADEQAFRAHEKEQVVNLKHACVQLCASFQVPCETICVEKESVTEGILELISQLRIRNLVMGAAANERYSRRMVTPTSKKANVLLYHAPYYCRIWFVCKEQLIYTRYQGRIKEPNVDIDQRPSTSSEYNQPVSQTTSETVECEGSPDKLDRLPMFSILSLPIRSQESGSACSSPGSSFAEGEVNKLSFNLLVSLKNQGQHLGSSSASAMNSSMDENLYDPPEQDGFGQSVRGLESDKEVTESIHMLETWLSNASDKQQHSEEFTVSEVIEEELATRNKELEKMKEQCEKVSQELQEALDQKSLLEKQITESDIALEEFKDNIMLSVDLLYKFKNDRERFEIERDHAMQEAQELRKQLAEETSSSSHVHFAMFPYSDLEIATNYFDPSMKIGEGDYGTMFKGFLFHTEVVIKILNPNTIQSAQEFDQEVTILSKLRHPNLVTLIGACPEYWTLVYEYLSSGSLEDRLICKNNTIPLTWQARIRIATELLSALIFLHSSQPDCIIHGNLSPKNILLDHNFVCKIRDFGTCYAISNDKNSTEQTTRLLRTMSKGTLTYTDPEFLSTGKLTPKADVYSFGITLLRLLTGKPALGIAKEVELALDKGSLNAILDHSAGNWPFIQAEQLAHMALRCCDMNSKNRPDLEFDVWRVLKPMKATSRSLSMIRRSSDDQAPPYFICPIFQEVMEDPHIAADGFTYEGEAIKGWLDSAHNTSPMTNVILANHILVPNRALRSAIQEWLQHHR